MILLLLFIIYVKSLQNIWYSMKFSFATKMKNSDPISKYNQLFFFLQEMVCLEISEFHGQISNELIFKKNNITFIFNTENTCTTPYLNEEAKQIDHSLIHLNIVSFIKKKKKKKQTKIKQIATGRFQSTGKLLVLIVLGMLH